LDNMSVESTLFDIFDHMSLAEKHEIVAELQRRIDAEECMAKYLPEKTYLEKNWEEIMRLIYELSCEPYIDDQYEIEEIWDKVEEMIRSGKLTSEPWRVRWTIIRDISDNDEYDYYGVCDPMRNLVRTLITNDEEKKQFADYLWETPYHSRELADKLYQELGEYDRHLEYIEEGLGNNVQPYLELIHYYADKDEVKALAFAEQARVKCRKDLDEVYIYMLTCAMKKDDIEEIKRLLRSAKVKSGADYDHIVVAAGAEEYETAVRKRKREEKCTNP